jgi:hypothetical protein
MNYQGNTNLGDTIDIKFTTVNTTGVPTTLAGSPAVAAYVDNGTTEITAGITLTVDFDARTGLHNVRVVASSGNGFATATNVNLVIIAGTVGGNSVVGYVIGSFSIEKRAELRPTTAGRTLDVTATGEAGVDWANIGAPTTSQNLSATTISSSQVAASVTAPVTLTSAYDAAKTASSQSTQDTLATYVDTEVAAIKSKTDNLPVDPADASDIAASFATLNVKVDTIDDFLDTEIAAIKAKTDQMVFTAGKIDANATLALVAGDITAIADGILKRDWTAVSGEAAYSLLNAARMLRNVWNTTGGTLSVKKEDGTTNAWQRTLAVDPTAQPIVGAT